MVVVVGAVLVLELVLVVAMELMLVLVLVLVADMDADMGVQPSQQPILCNADASQQPDRTLIIQCTDC
jgi:hypothetical protein